MWSIVKKEVNLFFSSLIGYIAIGVFLVVCSLFLWVFPDTNIFTGGYATLNSFFELAPLILMFLVPSLTMRFFSEEIKSGTMEILATKPVSDLQIIGGKFLASAILILFTLLPTLVYFYSVSYLASPQGNIDAGAIWGSYIGLFLLGASFAAIGIFSSALTSNQVVAFVLGVFLCFVFYQSFDLISNLGIFYAKVDDIVQQLGISRHYQSISRGVVDTRDIVYFLSLISAFILLTKYVVGSRRW